MSETKLCKSHGKWVARFGNITKTFNTMDEAVQWVEEQQEKERNNGRTD